MWVLVGGYPPCLPFQSQPWRELADSRLMRHQTPKLILMSLLLSLLWLSPAHADEDEFNGVNSWVQGMDKLKSEAEGHFDGGAMLPGANPSKMSSLARDMAFKLKYAIKNYNVLSRDLRASPKGQVAAAALRAHQGYIKTLGEAATVGAKAASNARKMCWNFKKEFRSRKGFNLDTPIAILLDPDRARYPGQNYTPEFLAEVESQLAEVEEVCDRPEYKEVIPHCNASKSEGEWKMLMVAKGFPEMWCKAARERKQVLTKAIENFVGTDDKRRSRSVAGDPAKLERKEGWIAEDRAVEWKTFFFVTAEQQTEALGKYASLYEAIGVTPGGDEGALDERKKAKELLRTTVQELAENWKTPPAGPSHYGVSLAKKTIKRWHKGAKVMKAFGSKPGGWNIHTNRIGVPEYRDSWGYVLFRVKAAPLCQLRKFVVSEDYAGGGRYKKAKHVSFSSVRWQNCR